MKFLLKLVQLCQPSVLGSQIRINFPQKNEAPKQEKIAPFKIIFPQQRVT